MNDGWAYEIDQLSAKVAQLGKVVVLQTQQIETLNGVVTNLARIVTLQDGELKALAKRLEALAARVEGRAELVVSAD